VNDIVTFERTLSGKDGTENLTSSQGQLKNSLTKQTRKKRAEKNLPRPERASPSNTSVREIHDNTVDISDNELVSIPQRVIKFGTSDDICDKQYQSSVHL
jgi:hypothetical protein